MRRLLLPLCLLVLAAAAPVAALAQTAASPTATTLAADPVGVDTATVHGRVDAKGQPTSYRFEYGTTTSYGLTTSDQSAGSGAVPVDLDAALSGLSGDTTYHYRVVAWPNSDPTAVVRGNDRAFRTFAPPGVSTETVHDLRADGATLIGHVDPNRSPTTVTFEWGTTSAYGNVTPVMDAGKGSASIPLTFQLSGLQPNTVYHYRTVATNAFGTSRAGERAFRTRRGAAEIAVGSLVRSVRYGRVMRIDGAVRGGGVDGIHVRLEAQPFPFKAPFAPIGDVVSAAADGSFHLLTPPLQISTRLRVMTRSTPSIASPEIMAFTQVLVGARKVRIGGGRYAILGTVTPRLRGARVTVQRRSGRSWVPAARSSTRGIGGGLVGYRAVVAQGRRPRALRVVVRPPTRAYAAGTSRTMTLPRAGRRRR